MKEPAPYDAEEAALAARLDPARLPRHLACIMDGNGRWAKKLTRERLFGHHHGRESVRMVIQTCRRLGIRFLTLYTFSSENWSRSPLEVEGLMRLLQNTMAAEEEGLARGGVKLRLIGRLDRLPAPVRDQMERSREALAGGTELELALAIDYGSRDELVRAARVLCREAKEGRLDPEDLDEAMLGGYLDTRGMPDPELVIRTGGEVRVSNYLLWQSAYAELHFTETLWPDLSRRELLSALVDFQARDRRFGSAQA